MTEGIREEIKKYLETNDNENTTAQNLWDAAKAVLRGKFINTILRQETRKISNKQPNLTPKAIRERRTKNPKVSRRKEFIQIRSEVNEKEMKKIIAKINKTKSWFFLKINKMDKPLARLIKKKREKTQINRITKKENYTCDHSVHHMDKRGSCHVSKGTLVRAHLYPW